MANQITVTTSTLRNKASSLQSSNGQLKTQITQLQQQESSLCSMWEGDAKTAFDKAFRSDIQQMQNFTKEIDQYVAKLNEIIKSYEEAERRNTQTASQRSYK